MHSPDSVFLKAFCGLQPPRILWKKLRPLALGHVLIGMAQGNPFFTGSGLKTLGDLAAAVWMCSHEVSQLRSMSFQMPTARGIRRWVGRCRRMDIAHEFERFERYLDVYCEYPDFWSESKTPPRELGAPWPYTIAWALMEHGHIPEWQVWGLPVNYASALYGACGEAHGQELVTPEEEAELDRQERESKKKKEQDES